MAGTTAGSGSILPSPTSAEPPSAPGAHAAPVELHTPRSPREEARRIALLGNPNTGKTTLFNRLSGLRAKTSNFPGTTLEARITRVKAGIEGGRDGDLIDLPGIYSLELDQIEARICREVLAGAAAPRGEPLGAPEVVVVVVDAANLARNLMLVGEAIRRRLPMVVALNLIDIARSSGLAIDAPRLAEALGCGVVETNARTGEGIDDLRRAIRGARIPTPALPIPSTTEGLREWAEDMFTRAAEGSAAAPEIPETRSDRADRLLLHPILGLAVFAAIMTGLFYSLFVLAQFPMAAIDAIFSWTGGVIERSLPEGPLSDLLANGIIAGIGGTVIFLPQICLLFFLISLLEDTGYLARGAFLVDRLLRPFGLPGHAFVPLLSSHACALPGIMATRAVPDPKERLATILIAPFMTCSARLPVYVLLTTLLFPGRPLMAALAFVGCYALGMIAGVLSALIARRTILRGRSRPMALELPCYKWPSLRTAALTTFDRAKVFLRNAGTTILMICIVLWWLGSYPKVEPPPEAAAIRAAVAGATSDDAPAPSVSDVFAHPHREHWTVGQALAEADAIEARHQAARSYLGRLGTFLQPVFAPLGYDRQLTIGVLASFAAREVFVSTMSIVVAGQEEEDESLFQTLSTATRDDGRTPIFTAATSWSLLVYYVLAMQCLPTLAVTAREAGGRKWAFLQLLWMCGLAYLAAFIVFRIAS